MSATNMRIEPAQEHDLPRLAHIFTTAFSHIPWLRLVGYTPDSAGHALFTTNTLRAWALHSQKFSTPMTLKCVYKNPESGEEVIVGMANWIFHEREMAEREFAEWSYIFSAEWVADATQRAQARAFVRGMLDRQVKWMGGRAFGELHFLCVDPVWERRGAGSALVRWGVQRCRELGVPGWADATEVARRVYEREGFVCVEGVAVMVWWPEGWGEGERGMALPGWEGRGGDGE
ncbi:hypothetical protein M409DRAFT_23109 [Zasmidium cellare ATCC 36951]|uniref:N-acetyltransferase domain-containing protein n=1 Tax=Zasmidium cellare ATCC 36951 TaxID=1080233 RepID=A0A6A6CJY7_ZASCE|nr:uncharacterized protein M409DRAFT_23109 [Zasmidium cellare ATCC 36951]KAF2166470.1 hypothetical protein M409DRAFT_23109 [Zasmidium cellare ATCC 36951]